MSYFSSFGYHTVATQGKYSDIFMFKRLPEITYLKLCVCTYVDIVTVHKKDPSRIYTDSTDRGKNKLTFINPPNPGVKPPALNNFSGNVDKSLALVLQLKKDSEQGWQELYQQYFMKSLVRCVRHLS